MVILPNGDKFRNLPTDPLTLEGYTLDPNNPKLFKQQFLPCKHRVEKQCAVCPKTKERKLRPTCSLKRITTSLTCVGCLERVP